MNMGICEVCQNQFPSGNRYLQDDSDLDTECGQRKISNQATKKKPQPARTSTPIPGLENSAPSGTSDSVTDFFYQTWKNGLLNNGEATENQEEQQAAQMPQEPINVQPVYTLTEPILVNNVIFQPLMATSYFQPLGIVPNGTLGILTTYLPCNVYNFTS